MKYKPMLAKIGTKDLLEDKELIFEPKLDGYRALCEVSPRSMKFYSRRGIDITKQFPEFDFRDRIDAKNCILDGEIIVENKKGYSDFHLLQGRSQLQDEAIIKEKSSKHPAVYAVFDILSKDGTSLLKKPFMQRHAILHETVQPNKEILLLPWTHDGKKLFTQMKKEKREGVMAKEPNGIYSPGKRTRAWQKVKTLKSLECVVLGYTQEKKLISSLALGLYDTKGALIYIGRVGTGFSQDKIDELYPKLQKQKSAKAPIADMPTFKHMHFVHPRIVVEVKYLELDSKGILRHTAYLHYRDDKKPKACTFDQIS